MVPRIELRLTVFKGHALIPIQSSWLCDSNPIAWLRGLNETLMIKDIAWCSIMLGIREIK